MYVFSSVLTTPGQPHKPLHEWEPVCKPSTADHSQILPAAQGHGRRRWHYQVRPAWCVNITGNIKIMELHMLKRFLQQIWTILTIILHCKKPKNITWLLVWSLSGHLGWAKESRWVKMVQRKILIYVAEIEEFLFNVASINSIYTI